MHAQCTLYVCVACACVYLCLLHVHCCILIHITCLNHKGVTSHMWKRTNSIARMQCVDQEVNHKCVGIQQFQHCAEQQKAHQHSVQIQTISMKHVELCATSPQRSGWNFSPYTYMKCSAQTYLSMKALGVCKSSVEFKQECAIVLHTPI